MSAAKRDETHEQLVHAIDRLHEEGMTVGSPTAETAALDLAAALGWEDRDTNNQPFGEWIRMRLREVLR